MVLYHNGIICGGKEYLPKLEKVGNTDRLTFCVLITRGGNLKKNFDIFQVKCFGTMAKKYYEELKDNKAQGKTVGLQMSLENNSNGFLYEFICTFVNFALGEEIEMKNLPDFAKVPSSVSKAQMVEEKNVASAKETTCQPTTKTEDSRPQNVVSKPIVNQLPEPVKENEVVEMAAETMGEIADVMLQAPIGVIARTRSIFANAKLVGVKRGVSGALAENPEYLVFREMMGY